MEDQNTNINEGKESQEMPISPNIPTPSPELSTSPSAPIAPDIDTSQTIDATTTAPTTTELETKIPEKAPISDFKLPEKFVEASKEAPSPQLAPLIVEEEKPMPVVQKPKENFLKKNQKIFKNIGIGTGALAIIAGAIFAYLIFFKKAMVTINANQSPIDIIVGGQTYTNIIPPYTLQLPKGSYEVTVSKIDFLNSTQKLDIQSTAKQYSLAFNLKAQPVPERLTEKEPFFPILNMDTGIILYFEKGETGYNLKEFNPSDQSTINVLGPIEQITKVVWSPSYRQAAVKVINSAENKNSILPYLSKYPEGERVNWILNTERRDLVNINAKDLIPEIKNISFNPEGNKIVYFFQRGDYRNLSIANTDGSNYEPVAQIQSFTFEADVVWSPEGGRRVAYFANTENGRTSNVNDANVFVYDLIARQKIDVSRDGVSTGSLFSPDGNFLIYESGGDIHLFDLEESNPTSADLDLKINGSVANCAWVDNQTFVAYDRSEGSILKVKINGEKEDIGYRKESIPSGIKSISAKDNSVYLFTSTGIYRLEMEQGL